MAKQNVAEQFVDILVRAGVRRLYGVVGDSLNPVVDTVRPNAVIDWIHVRHEETAAFAAGAEAQITGKLAACAGSCCPGNLHLINGLYDAHRSMAPVLALASRIPSGEIGLGYFQETHPDRLFQGCSHYSELISSPRQMPRLLQTAIQHAVGQSGVSVVALPGDIAAEPVPEKAPQSALVTSRPTVRPGDAEIDALAEMIDEADRVTLFCGSGTAGAHAEVMQFAKKIKSPVGHALRGKEFIQYDNEFDVGMSGLLGYGAAYEATHECELLILLATDFPYNAFLPDDVKIAQVDVRPEVLGRRSRLDLASTSASRSTPSTWPSSSTKSPTTTPCSPSTPACAMCGPRGTCRPTAAAGSSVRSRTARWRTRCPWRSAPNSPTGAGRWSPCPATEGSPC
jgi:pyruvate dehydrogenase (quinone)